MNLYELIQKYEEIGYKNADAVAKVTQQLNDSMSSLVKIMTLKIRIRK